MAVVLNHHVIAVAVFATAIYGAAFVLVFFIIVVVIVVVVGVRFCTGIARSDGRAAPHQSQLIRRKVLTQNVRPIFLGFIL